MFQPKVRQVVYKIHKQSGESVCIPVWLNEHGLAGDRSPGAVEAPATDCVGCERQHGRCQAEDALAPIMAAFEDLQSIDTVQAEAHIEGRVIGIQSPAPRVLASVMGLLMASSGCPRLAPFRGMALFHQPFATPEENVVRAIGFWLMGCWTRHETLGPESLAPLRAAWDNLEDVNRHVASKILARSTSDVASNGIAFLDALAKVGTIGLESAIETLRPVLSATAPQPAN